MPTTHTGSYPIGFRRGWADWQRDLPQLLAFARQHGFAFVDFGPIGPDELRQVQSAGVRVGSVDLKDWKDLLSPDRGQRRAAVQANIEHVHSAATMGVGLFLSVLVPEDPARARSENFSFAVDAYGELLEATAATGAKIVLEGWPGQPPHYGSLACTPADLRAIFNALDSNALGVNFDPSHLLRMGIDIVRFIHEFAGRIHHAHAKDTELLADGLYAHGNTQVATFDQPRAFGGYCWRYAVPGEGHVPWRRVLETLQSVGYRGLLSIEMEDERFNGTPDGERRGLLASRDFLAGT